MQEGREANVKSEVYCSREQNLACYDLLMKPISDWWRLRSKWHMHLFVSGWRGDSQGRLGEEHAHDWSPQQGGGTGHALLRAGDEPPGRHGESEAGPACLTVISDPTGCRSESSRHAAADICFNFTPCRLPQRKTTDSVCRTLHKTLTSMLSFFFILFWTLTVYSVLWDVSHSMVVDSFWPLLPDYQITFACRARWVMQVGSSLTCFSPNHCTKVTLHTTVCKRDTQKTLRLISAPTCTQHRHTVLPPNIAHLEVSQPVWWRLQGTSAAGNPINYSDHSERHKCHTD